MPMIGIPLSTFYLIYVGLVLVYLAFTFFNIYHLVRFGAFTIASISITIFYLFVSLAIIVMSWLYLSQFDWQQVIPLTIQATL